MKNEPVELHEVNLELLGTILREIRLQLDLTQLQVSEATGLHVNSISNIERGYSCRIDNFITIAQHYELKPSDILSVIDL